MKKINERIAATVKILELILAMCVLVGFVLAAWYYFVEMNIFGDVLSGSMSFNHFLEIILGLVIGVEFLELMIMPDSAHALEVLIFLVSRHLVVGSASPLENFISVFAVCLLCVVRRFLHNNKVHEIEAEEDRQHEEELHHLEEEKLRLDIEEERKRIEAIK